MTARLGVAVVGLGLAGSHMAAAVRDHPEVRLACGADPQATLRDRFAAIERLPVHDGLAGVLGQSDVDIVYLATPPELHRDQAVRAAAAGRHVLVEKPMAPSHVDCLAMADAAAAAGVVLVVGHTHGFDPAVGVVADLVRSGVYGPPSLVTNLTYTNFLYRPRRPAELDPEQGGGVVLNQVAHQVDIAMSVIGLPVRSVRAVTTRLDAARPVDGSCIALLDFGGGVAANLVYAGYDHFDTDEFHGWVRESGDAGTPRHGAARRALRELDGPEDAARTARLGYGAGELPVPAHQPHFGVLLVSCTDADLRIGPDAVLAYTDSGVVTHEVGPSRGRPGHAEVLDAVVAAVRTGRPSSHDGNFGAAVVEVCEAILRSAAVHADVALTTGAVTA